MTFGNLIESKRREKDWSLKEVSYELGVSTTLIRGWENGLHIPEPFNLQCLLDLYKINPEEHKLIFKPAILTKCDIGSFLREKRKEKKLSAKEVSNLTKLGHGMIYQWETDRHAPKSKQLKKLINLYEIKPEDYPDLFEFGWEVISWE